MAENAPAAPRDLVAKGRGRRFWRSVVTTWQLRADELELLAEACRQLDMCERLRAEVDAGPLLINDRLNPLAVELRQCRQELRRTLGQLALPDPDADADEIRTARSERARRAVRVRWARDGI